MPFCKSCGGKIEASDVFCGNCGAKVTFDLAESVEPQKWSNLRDHIENLRKIGLLQSEIVARAQERESWDPKKYLGNVFESIILGGFSYFTYTGDDAQEGVKERTPILMKDESLKKVGDIKSNFIDWGDIWGPLYYTGRRFIVESRRFKFPSDPRVGEIYSLPYNSYWIKPNFSDLFSLLAVSYFLEEGTFRKKRYNKLEFTAIRVNRRLKCGYIVDCPNGQKLYNDVYMQYWSYPSGAVRELEQNLRDLIDEARETKSSDLIEHTYTCYPRSDVFIETNILTGPKKVSERPISYWGPLLYTV